MEEFKVTKINDPVLNNFLIERDIKEQFIKNCNRDYENIPFIITDEEKETCRKDVERENVLMGVIADSFPWEYTPEGEKFWHVLHFKFIQVKTQHMWKTSNYTKICLN